MNCTTSRAVSTTKPEMPAAAWIRSRIAPDTKLDAAIEVGANGELRERNLFHNGVSGAWRMTVRFKRADASKPVELRAAIKQAQNTLTETWSYIVPPESEKQ